ncbi:MAG: bile acid:sodium symporter family protein [Nitrospinaceae bacterium]
MNKTERLFLALANAFPLWVLAGAVLAFWNPATALWFQPTWIPFFLGVIMLSMGLTLDFKDFLRVFQIPRPIFLGVGLQYLIMPFLGFTLSRAFHLPIDYIIGMVLVACCPGGTASNVVCFIARTNVALSVSLTTFSTLLAVLMTPLLTTLLIESLSRDLLGNPIQVDTLGLLINTFKVVIVPVIMGVFLNHYFHSWVRKVNAYTPLLAVLSIVFIVDFILAAKKGAIMESGLSLLAAIFLLHALGFILGYVLSRWLKFQKRDAQTVSIEVGMQNSGLATELARSNFPAFGLATVPGAISALTHCILGSVAAGLCRIRPEPEIGMQPEESGITG